jgi:DNA-binding transcriptional LysR family regulator
MDKFVLFPASPAGEGMIDEISGDLFQWLRGFYFVAEKGSARQAATAMGRQQPTITRQIQCLEKELGVTLFDRSMGKMKMTPEGKLLLERAVSLFEDVKGIKDEFRKRESEYEGKIVIASTHAIIDSFLPPYVGRFKRMHPRVTFHFEGGIRETVFEKIESGEADLGIGYFESVPKMIKYYNVAETALILIAPKNNKFFPDASPTLKQIAQAPLILFSHRGSLDRGIERRFSEERLKPNVVMTHNNHASIRKYVSLGMGVAILGVHAVSKEDEALIDILPLDQYFPKRKYGLLLRKRKYLSPMLKAFIRRIKPDIDFTKNTTEE